jgi:hypothetical protein
MATPEKTEPACPVVECGAMPDSGPPMKCRGYGHRDPRCMGNWLHIDPEHAGTYDQYLAHETETCGPEYPYTVVHEVTARLAEKGAL